MLATASPVVSVTVVFEDRKELLRSYVEGVLAMVSPGHFARQRVRFVSKHLHLTRFDLIDTDAPVDFPFRPGKNK